MNTIALVTMIAVLTTIWGGFLTALVLALRKETRDPSKSQTKKHQES
jgi:hypothetical protein